MQVDKFYAIWHVTTQIDFKWKCSSIQITSVVRVIAFFYKWMKGDIKMTTRQKSKAGGDIEQTWTFWKMIVSLVGD